MSEPTTPENTPPTPKPGIAPSKIAKREANKAPEVIRVLNADEQALAKKAAEFGRVEEDGQVYLIEDGKERLVGQKIGVTPTEALDFYIRRYLDLKSKIDLLQARLANPEVSLKEVDTTAKKLAEELTSPSAVGNIPELRTQLESVNTVINERREEQSKARAKAKEEATKVREKIVLEAEKITALPPEKTQWRPVGNRLNILLDEWRSEQRKIRIDRNIEDELWKRFSKTRTTFDRNRRHYFAQLEASNKAARETKQSLIEKAKQLSTSTEWAKTTAAFKQLLDEWKAAGRATKTEDDKLWEEFRAAQDVFFAAKKEHLEIQNEEFKQNLVIKEELLVQAEKLLPVKDVNLAKKELRKIQEAWEDAGKVPRNDIQRVEGRLRAVEKAIRDAEQEHWSRTNPETQARAQGALSQLENAIAALESELETAKAANNTKAIKETEKALEARKSWLEQINKSVLGN